MWYFSWILGTALALAFGVLNAMWYELMEQPPRPPQGAGQPPAPAGALNQRSPAAATDQPSAPRTAERASVI
jgi:cytochrome bd-I ubiquinol oxidase subunit X